MIDHGSEECWSGIHARITDEYVLRKPAKIVMRSWWRVYLQAIRSTSIVTIPKTVFK
jgi:hypothetical protein